MCGKIYKQYMSYMSKIIERKYVCACKTQSRYTSSYKKEQEGTLYYNKQ